jgi:hypothetical protein
MALQDVYKLELTVALFNQGCASFERAVQASGAEAETARISAARDIPDSLEWALKIYLQNFPKLPSEARRKLRHPNFNDLINLMKMYGDPPLDDATGRQMYGYRDMRNEATHKGAIPPINEVRNAMEGVSHFLRTYLNVSNEQLNRTKSPKPELDLGVLRQRINRLFDDVTLTAFCLDNFTEVYDKFSAGMRRDEKITLLLDYCRRDPEQYQRLLDALKKKEKPEPPTAPPSLTSSQRRRLEREKRDQEGHVERLSEKISALRRDLSLETRSDEQQRLQAVIEDNEALLVEFENKLDEIERKLG